MADEQPRSTKARARAVAAGIDAARRRAGLTLSDGAIAEANRLRRLLSQWVLAEVAPGRLMPWLPVGFGFGIVLYFTAEREPAGWAATALMIAAVVIVVLARRSGVGFVLALGAAAIASGFAVATLHAVRIAHPVLAFPTWSAQVAGFVELREERARSDRVVVRVERITAPRMRVKPDRVRVAVRKGTAPPVGQFVAFRAYLSPPLQPLRPGGYDFARDLYFQRIGASGYVLGRIATKPQPHAPGLWLRYAAVIETLREAIDDRIHAVLSGDRGAIASALITGKRGTISQPVNDAMYVSGLGHVLSISGYHMAVVAGIVFFIIRGVLALVPALANLRPIKKWAAAGALLAAAFYLLLSGAEVATRRSFIMVAIVLIGVMLDRPALTLRTLAVAAFAVLLFSPHAVVHPSFQMSFAATLALVAAYQHGLPWRADAGSSAGTRMALWGWREVVGLILVSLVAGLATTPYAAYHFHRLAPYGVVANLAAMPVVSLWVMPMGILGLVLLPFGFDAPLWHLMAQAIDWMVAVALWVADRPGAFGRVHAFGPGVLALATAGLLLVCLLRTPLRWSGALLGVAAGLWALQTPNPDILVAADGWTVAVRGRGGHLAVLHSGRDRFALKDWLASDADARDARDASLHEGVRCDAAGCIGSMAGGRLVAYALSASAFAEDCVRAAVVVSRRVAPGPCRAVLIDRNAWRAEGAIALRWTGQHFARSAGRPPGYARPWTHPERTSGRRATRPAAHDATPDENDLEPGDQ